MSPDYQRLPIYLAALANPTRYQIVSMACEKPVYIQFVLEKLYIHKANLSQHTRILQNCGLIVLDQSGKQKVIHATCLAKSLVISIENAVSQHD